MSNLGIAISITANAFVNKKDKGGNPYILHCLHVMNKMKYHDEELMMMGVMHDLVEDTDYTIDSLLNLGFSNRVLLGIKYLTHDDNLSYADYITRMIANSPDAMLIKMQDLRHNSDITRIKGITKKDFDRIEKYHKSYLRLKEA